MEVVAEIRALRERREAMRGSVGLVPTMGNLHEGHLALVHEARQECANVVATIFVNPTQFAPNEDFASYPRTLAEDLERLEKAGVDVVFAPDTAEMYPRGRERLTTVSVPALADTLCGAARPGHFDGVATVVAKLLHLAAPHRAFFGEKDWQQLAIIQAMVRDLDMATQIVGVPTVRAGDGLALSSRNQYLTPDERELAPLIFRKLCDVRDAVHRGERNFARLAADASQDLATAGFHVDYVAVRDAERLVTPDSRTPSLRILAAARLGRARLIDNIGADVAVPS
ncbi:MAG: pantoate--beta-alanine ligase [Gammaproteobacteria bacterium]|nr:pantoate--beta-alanine ligase [Gammaproteobacteria bacterium]MYB37869.1 pantoate--beta-alanine ligase [Gammaproteobacteria bacterium]